MSHEPDVMINVGGGYYVRCDDCGYESPELFDTSEEADGAVAQHMNEIRISGTGF
jgi:hypothetical protein